jgi:hypothetical protein
VFNWFDTNHHGLNVWPFICLTFFYFICHYTISPL